MAGGPPDRPVRPRASPTSLGASGKRRLRRESYGDGGEPSRTCAAKSGDRDRGPRAAMLRGAWLGGEPGIARRRVRSRSRRPGHSLGTAMCASQKGDGGSQYGHRMKLSLRYAAAFAGSSDRVPVDHRHDVAHERGQQGRRRRLGRSNFT
jgi:hypothetical protein